MTPITLRRRLLALLAVFALFATACGEDEADEASDRPAVDESDDAGDDSDEEDDDAPGVIDLALADLEPAPPVSWTFMVYLIGDTDLEPFAIQDMTEMAGVGSQDELNIVALVDRAEGYTDEGVVDQPDWETGKLFHVLPDSLVEVADFGEIEMGEPGTFSQFVANTMNLYPADRYALSVWDHGGGWTGMGPDDSSGDVLDLPETVRGLRSALARTDADSLDLLGFDACLMATYEVASALAPFSDYFLASQELEPGHGWDYGSLRVLAENPDIDGAGLGRALIEGFNQHAVDNDTLADITLSLIDNSAMGALDTAMADFAAELAAQGDAIAPTVGRQRAQTLEFGRSENPESSSNLADLGVFVSEIGVKSLQVSDQADAVIRALNDAVIERTAGPARLGATGLSIYFPPTASSFDGQYPSGDIAAAGAWSAFLSSYHGLGAAIPEESQAAFADPDAPLEVFDVDGGVEVEAAFDPDALANLVDAYISYGVTDPETGNIILLGDDDAVISEDGSNTVVGFSDLTVFTISDGEDEMLAYWGFTVDENSGFGEASIPLDYYAPDAEEPETVELTIVVDLETGDIVEETYWVVDESGTWGQLSADPAGIIVPVVPVLTEDGDTEWEAFGPGLFADTAQLSYSFEPIEPGTEVYVELGIEDFGGNVASVEGFFDA